MSHPKKKPVPELAELVGDESSEPIHPPFETGRRAGAAVLRLLSNRGDHITASVEWYRGFCSACGKLPDPKVEAFIAKEICRIAFKTERGA